MPRLPPVIKATLPCNPSSMRSTFPSIVINQEIISNSLCHACAAGTLSRTTPDFEMVFAWRLAGRHILFQMITQRGRFTKSVYFGYPGRHDAASWLTDSRDWPGCARFPRSRIAKETGRKRLAGWAHLQQPTICESRDGLLPLTGSTRHNHLPNHPFTQRGKV